MVRITLLLLGIVLLIFQQYIIDFNAHAQFFIFLAGIIVLGVPHGAADLLVASRNAVVRGRRFSKIKFLAAYISRLFLFAAVLWLFPLLGNVLFIIFAAYHFGETDLYQFNIDTPIGKLFVISYGLVILSVIILGHFDEVRLLFRLFATGTENSKLINWIDGNHYNLMTMSGVLFFVTTFFYFLKSKDAANDGRGKFLLYFAAMLVILFILPLMLGFTFYFIVWHSVLSLRNIYVYLRRNNLFTGRVIAGQVLLYSALALVGIALFGLTGFMFVNINAMAGSIFFGLAVLTAPHMQIMHDMYNSIRLGKLFQ